MEIIINRQVGGERADETGDRLGSIEELQAFELSEGKRSVGAGFPAFFVQWTLCKPRI